MENNLWVTAVLFTPLVGLIPLIFFTRGREERIKWITLIFTVLTLGAATIMLSQFDPTKADMQLVHFQEWFKVGNFQISYHVGVDGLSIWLVYLTAFIMPLAALFSLNYIKDRVRLYYCFLLLLEFAMIGVFVAQDLFLFYIFWEISLVPMYFLVGIWGSEQRIYAAVKFFIYTMAGSILMLLAILWMGNQFGTFNVTEITRGIWAQDPKFAFPTYTTEALLFLGFFIAFAIKVPVWPFHSWLPDAHVQAPTAGSVILAGVLLKLGTYGLVRFCLGFFPQASINAAPVIAILAVIGIIYGAWVSYAQTDVKKLVAYSSISHLGFVVLGIFALHASGNSAGIAGATLQMVNHGISTGGLFLMVGMLYERRHTKAIDAFGGIWKLMPVFSGLGLIITFSSMGLPGLNGFVGEFTILLGAFSASTVGPILTALATTGVILAAVYLLFMWNKVFMGEPKAAAASGEDSHGHDAHGHDAHGHDAHGDSHANQYPPLTWNELTALVVVVIAALIIGLMPRPFFEYMDASASQYARQVGSFIESSASVQNADATSMVSE
jgi:NADH-quinone oxidoreductase subunit M